MTSASLKRMRRPKREENSKSMFLDTQYAVMKKLLDKKDDKGIFEAYEQIKHSCNACHHAEKVPFIKVVDPQYRWQPIH